MCHVNTVMVDGVPHATGYFSEDDDPGEQAWTDAVAAHDPTPEPSDDTPTVEERLAALEARMDRAAEGAADEAVARADLRG